MEHTTGLSGLAEGAARVLVVDDFDLRRRLIIRVLLDEGHQVHGAATAAGALSYCRRERIDLLVTNMAVPGGRGIDIARLAVGMNPTMRVLFVSECPLAADQLAIDGTRTRLLSKEFDVDGLVESVRDLLVSSAV